MDERGQFSVTLPLLKSWEGADGQMYFEGVAASTTLDRQNERMTPEAIEKMQGYSDIDLLPSHKAGALDELGTVKECRADNDRFRVSGVLDADNAEAQRLFQKVQSGRRYGLSVGGRVLKAHWEYDPEAKKQVKYIDDVALDHIALCRPEQAANPDTYLTVLAKAAEGVMEAPGDDAAGAEDPSAVFARLGRGLVEACQRLWPFGDVEQGSDVEKAHPTDTSCPDVSMAEPTALNKQSDDGDETEPLQKLQERVDELSGSVTELQGTVQDLCKDDDGEDTDVMPGRTQAIPGQDVPEGTANTWKGVL